MTNIRQLVENKRKLDYPALCKALIQQFGVSEPVSWDSILPAPQQQELFGGEVLRFVETHPELAKQKDIRPISLKKGSISQMLFFYVTLSDTTLPIALNKPSYSGHCTSTNVGRKPLRLPNDLSTDI